jgi:hypothetical protein
MAFLNEKIFSQECMTVKKVKKKMKKKKFFYKIKKIFFETKQNKYH